MKVTQICIGRFHHFHLARQFEKFDLLDKIITSYPKFKLKQENGISSNKIKTFPYSMAPYLFLQGKLPKSMDEVKKQWRLLNHQFLDYYSSKLIIEPTNLVALSCSGLKSGLKNKAMGGNYICDRGSSHIRFQNQLLKEEYERWNIPFAGNYEAIMAREEEEYEVADYITVPSQFVYNSFLDMGISSKKLIKIPYGANLHRFRKTGTPQKNEFKILWVGQVSIRKGFLYALQAFINLNHPNKTFNVIGSIEDKIKPLIAKIGHQHVNFLGKVPNTSLIEYYNTHNAFMLTSIEEGLAMVQGEALACGCPIIATPNTGSEDLITDGKEGLIVPARDVRSVTDAMQKIIDNPHLREEMGQNALQKVDALGGWDKYGLNFKNFINSI